MAFLGGIGRMLGLNRPRREENPANAAAPYFAQIPEQARAYMQHYINEGQAGPNQLTNIDPYYANLNNAASQENRAPDLYERGAPRQYGQMANDPQGFVNNIMRGYTPSEGYKFKQQQMGQAARNAAASGGFLGTQGDQMNQADIVRNLLGQDQQEYLRNIMNTQGSGLGGLERMLAGRERAGQFNAGMGERSRSARMQALLEQIYGKRQENLSELGQLSERRQRGFEAAQGITGANIGNLQQQGGWAAMGRAQRNLDNENRNRNMRNVMFPFGGPLNAGGGAWPGGGGGGGGMPGGQGGGAGGPGGGFGGGGGGGGFPFAAFL